MGSRCGADDTRGRVDLRGGTLSVAVRRLQRSRNGGRTLPGPGDARRPRRGGDGDAPPRRSSLRPPRRHRRYRRRAAACPGDGRRRVQPHLLPDPRHRLCLRALIRLPLRGHVAARFGGGHRGHRALASLRDVRLRLDRGGGGDRRAATLLDAGLRGRRRPRHRQRDCRLRLRSAPRRLGLDHLLPGQSLVRLPSGRRDGGAPAALRALLPGHVGGVGQLSCRR